MYEVEPKPSKCVVCRKYYAMFGANCDFCLYWIKKAQSNRSFKSKYFHYIDSCWTARGKLP